MMMKRKYLYSLLLFLLAFSITGANAADLFAPNPDDWYVINVIKAILTPDGNNPLAAMFLVTNAALLTFGGVLAAYTLLAGTMQTAHDGEMLGKKWSSMWIPIRTAVGVAMLLPAAGGFCAVQVLAIWCHTQGIGLADKTWNAYTNNYSSTPQYVPVDNGQRIREAAQLMVINNACVALYNRKQDYMSKNDKWGSGDYWRKAVPIKYSVGDNAVVGWKYGIADDGGIINTTSKQEICGNVYLNLADNKDAASKADAGTLVNAAIIYNNISDIQTEATIAMQSSAKAYAEQIVKSLNYPDIKLDPSAFNAQLNAMVKTYQNAVQEKAKAAYTDAINVDALKETQDKGFAFIGTYWNQYSKALSIVNSIVNNVPANGSLPPAVTGEQEGEQVAYMYGSVTRDNSISDQISKFAVLVRESDKYDAYASVNSSDKQSNFEKIVMWAGSSVFSKDMTSLGAETALYNIGNVMITTANTGAGIVGGGSLFAAIPFFGNAVTTVMTAFSGVLTIMFSTFYGCGMLLSYWLPMMPYMVWITVVMSTAMMGLEALVCFPLWAMAHLAPDADGFVGRQGMGYMMLMNLAFAPSMYVLGLIASHLTSQVGWELVNATFWTTASSLGGSGLSGVIANLAKIVIYTVMVYTVATTSLKMILKLPEVAFTLLGGKGGAIMSNMIQSDMEKTGANFGKVSAIAGPAISSTANGISSFNSKSADGFRKMMDHNRLNTSDESLNVGNAKDENNNETTNKVNHENTPPKGKKLGE